MKFLLSLLFLCLQVAAVELTLPPLSEGPAKAGRKVSVTATEYTGTMVHHTLWLPADWTPDWKAQGKTWPVVAEYTGNYYPASGSTGRVADAGLGFGLSRGQAIWVVLPYVARDHRKNEITWWGDVEATVNYAKTNLPLICAEFGGHPKKIVLCGFSRGAIGVSFLGLHDDEIARLWCGLHAHDHFDGVQEWRGTDWGTPLAKYRTEAAMRLHRLEGRPLLVTQGGNVAATQAWLTPLLRPETLTAQSVDMKALYGTFPNTSVQSAHTDRWLLKEGAPQAAAQGWFHAACEAERK